jgi:hypothetical protein
MQLKLKCEAGHEQAIRLEGYSLEEAVDLGQIMDGSSSLFVRKGPGLLVGRCAVMLRDVDGEKKCCGKAYRASAEG